jgi:hypothetical protein
MLQHMYPQGWCLLRYFVVAAGMQQIMQEPASISWQLFSIPAVPGTA